ncbi:MAG: tripartite tricarboxylate transporter permease, partial [Amphiplicatus sp.]
APKRVVGPVIVVLAVLGSYAINNSVFDVGLMIAFGMLGLIFDMVKMPTPPLVIGLILGPILEMTLNQSLLIGNGDWRIFFETPISAVLLFLALLSVLQTTPLFRLIANRITTSMRARK